MAQERIQKLLSQAGITSRRKAEELITAGHVSVRGRIVTTLGSKADWCDDIQVDGVPLVKPKMIYLAMFKPVRYEVSMNPGRHRSIYNLLPKGERLMAIGRLDAMSEGLLLFTNDGNFANMVMHPRYEKDKTYLVTILGRMTARHMYALQDGVRIHPLPTERSTSVVHARVHPIKEGKISKYEIVLHEGRKHIIRRIMQYIGLPVENLRRVRIGAVSLGKLKPGMWRYLSTQEIQSLTSDQKAMHRDASYSPQASR